MQKSAHLRRKRGFTLIEILVATVIMVILVGLVIQITSQVLNVWNRSSGRLSANAQARIALELLTQDLETAVFRNNGQQWLRVEAPRITGATDDSLYTNQTVALKLFSPALDRPTGPGDVAGIGYRLAFKESYPEGNEVYALYRAIESPANTFEDLMGSGSPSPQLSLEDDPVFWTDASITQPENYLAGNIVEFKILIYEEDTSATSPQLPVNADADGTLTGDYAFGGDRSDTVTEADPSSKPLRYADIILTVLSDEGVQILERGNLAGTGFETPTDVVRNFGETFTRRVNLPARPL